MTTFEQNMQRAFDAVTARYSSSHPKHMTAILKQLMGAIDACIQAEKLGPEMQRAKIIQHQKSMAGLVDELWRVTKQE